MQQLTPEQKEQMRQQCIFCQIIDGKVAAKKIYEDDKVLAVLDINPANPGHVLLLPKEHVSIMPQMNEELVEYMGVISKKISRLLLRAMKVEGTTIFVANGTAAGQRAPHFMMHIIPRMENDNVGIIPKLNKLSEEDILQVQEALHEPLKKVLGTVIAPSQKPKEKLTQPKSEEKNPGGQATDPSLDAISNLLTK